MQSERDGANTFGNNSRIGTSATNGPPVSFNIVNQRKTPNANQQMMMTT